MAAIRPSCETPEEHVVFWAIVMTWGLWLLGAIYHTFPLLGWGLALLAFGRRTGAFEDPGAAPRRLSRSVMLWIIGMGLMALALVVAHFDYELGFVRLVKSLSGWAKGWALLAVFIFAGADLRIKPQVICRATNILAAQTLIATPLLIVLAAAGAPEVLYVSPLQYLGGAGSIFFDVGSHSVDPGWPGFRLRYYAPWSPAAAFSAHILLVCGLYDEDWRWRLTGVVSAVVVCAMAQSRLSMIAIPVLLAGLPLLSNVLRAWPAVIAGVVSTVGLVMVAQVSDGFDRAMDAFVSARADSSRVRSALGRIAYQRWEQEAPVFGHGVVERGPHLVEYMPIGSHHTWYGLLFVKGAVGLLALAVPLAWSFVELWAKAQRDPIARAGLGVVIVLLINSFGENLEILAYLIWPGLLLMGAAHCRPLAWPAFVAPEIRALFSPHAELALTNSE